MLIKCPECKKEISNEALFCPFCGYPIKNDKQTEEKKSFTVAFRSGPGSIIGAVILIGVLTLFVLAGGVLSLIANSVNPDGGFLVAAIFLLTFGVIFAITVIVYIGYFVHNKQNMSRNCIEYDANEDKLVLCTLYGEIIKIDVSDYVDLKDNFFTDNMLLFTYRKKDGSLIKVKLGYCGNRDQIRSNIDKAGRMHG